MTVDDIRPELENLASAQGSFTEKGKPLGIIGKTLTAQIVQSAPVKIVIVLNQIDSNAGKHTLANSKTKS